MMFAGKQFDSSVVEYATTSGAIDLQAIDNLVRYLKAQNLFTSSRLYPAKSTQNKGTGSTLYGIGGLSTANLTLYDSPTWDSTGITLDTNDYIAGVIAELEGTQEVMVFCRQAPTLASLADSSRLIVTSIGNYRNTTPSGTGGWVGGISTLSTAGEIHSSSFTYNSDVVDGNRRLGSSFVGWSAGQDLTMVYQLGNDYEYWNNDTTCPMDKVSSMSATTDNAPSDLGTTGGHVVIGGQRTNGVNTSSSGRGIFKAQLYIARTTKLTSGQRTSIRALLAAL